MIPFNYDICRTSYAFNASHHRQKNQTFGVATIGLKADYNRAQICYTIVNFERK
jgi:hypothetical protein